ncbi:MAG: response regulator [Gammaproteobacteria bacterium]|nr:response regulator [Gammaproteobacteria bacterium]
MAKILSVDDSKVIREMVKAVLSAEGHEVTTANDGVEGLEAARNNQFDLILTDINMPNMNGISLVSKLRRMPAYLHTPIVMITTDNSDYKKSKSKTMGATGWLQKPFDPARLIQATKKLLG